VAALVGCALALYWGSLSHPLVFDDELLKEGFLRERAATPLGSGLRSLSYATFGWSYQLFGMDWPWYRFGNVLLHGLTASVLFLFLARLFAVAAPGDAAGRPAIEPRWAAFFGALLFLVHPVAVYGVAYLMQRPIVMATLFGLLSLWLFLEGLVRNGRGWHVASAAAYLAAVLSKEHAVMVPAVAVAVTVLVRGWPPRALRPLALPFALYAVIAALVILEAKGVLGAQYEPFAAEAARQLPGAGKIAPLELYLSSVVNQGLLFFRYLLVWLVPFPGWMSVDVRLAFPSGPGSPLHVAGFVAWLAWAALGAALLARGGRAALGGFAMLAPWLLALPEFAAVRVQEPFVLYRSYLWMSLLPAAVPVLAARLAPRWNFAMLAVACVALVPLALDRINSFSSAYRVWDDAVRKNTDPGVPYVDRAFRNRGVALYHLDRFEEALHDFSRALELDPRNVRSLQLRGAVYVRTGQNEKAMADLSRALELDPLHVEALGPRCVVLMRLRRYDAALTDCELAHRLKPGDIDHSISLGMVRAMRGEAAAAEQHYRRALEIDSSSPAARYQYGVLLYGMGRPREARDQFAVACAARMQAACLAIQRILGGK